MVLQRDASSPPATVWGFASAGVSVTTTFAGAALHSTTNAAGVWRQALPPTPASLTPFTLLFNASDGSSAALEDVLFGDVHFAGGQSNMALTVSSIFNATEEIAKADEYPHLRLVTVGQGTFSDTPLDDLASVEQPWTPASTASVGLGNWTAFSAVAWLYGRDLADALPGVPMGIVSSNWGGTPIQSWMSVEAMSACGVIPPPPTLASADPPTPSPYSNATLFNAMVLPFAVGPMALKTFAWYQAEANAPPFLTLPVWYACAFKGLVTEWRGVFSAPSAGFFFVQLAPFIGPADSGWADIRQAQLGALDLPRVGFATAVDVGDPQAPFGSYHPRNKQSVGARLSAAALALSYGRDVVWQGPRVEAVTAVHQAPPPHPHTGLPNVTVRVTFQPGTVSGGLVLHPASCPTALGVPLNLCADFVLYVSPGSNPPPPTYTYMPGFLGAGDDIVSGQFTLGGAQALCTSTPACLGVTFAGGERDPTTPTLMYLKSALSFTAAANWSTWANDKSPLGVALPATPSLTADGTALLLTAAPSGAGQTPTACAYAYATWPVTPLYNGAGLPAIPWRVNVTA